LCNESGGQIGSSYSLTVLSASTDFTYSFVTTSWTLYPDTIYYLLFSTTSSGFYWNEFNPGSITCYNKQATGNVAPLRSVNGGYALSIPGTMYAIGGDTNYGTIRIRGNVS